jgi:hypothetical protein
MKGTALRKLKNEKYKELTDGYVDDIRKNFNVTIDEATLASVDLDAAKVRRPDARSAAPVDPDAAGRPLTPTPGGSVPGEED